MNYRFNDPKSHEEGKAPYEDIVAAVQKGLLSKDVIVTGPHGSSTPFAEPDELTAVHDSPVMPVTPHSEEETVYFQDPFVTVTAARVVFGGTTFPLRNVSSVRVDVSPASYIFAGVLLLLGLGLGVAAVMLPTARMILVCCSGLMVVFGILAVVSAKTTYRLTVGNAGGEFLGTSSNSKGYMTKLHRALNEAIVNFS